MAVTARNLTRLADLANEQGLILYLEALGWCPLNRLSDQVELIHRSDRQNVKLVVDFWHCYVSGDTPEDAAKLGKDLIFGVHVCDSLLHESGVPNESVLRDVPTGQGVLDLKDWASAVISTGFQWLVEPGTVLPQTASIQQLQCGPEASIAFGRTDFRPKVKPGLALAGRRLQWARNGER